MKSIRLFIFIINILLVFIYSCGNSSSEKAMGIAEEEIAKEEPEYGWRDQKYNDREPTDEEINPVVLEYEDRDAVEDDTYIQPSEDPIDELEDLSIILSVDKELKIYETGTLKIWIGSSKIEVSYSDNKVTTEKHISSSIGQYAKIIPYAPDFEIDPLRMSCIKIHPSGSEVFFSIKPQKTGELIVSANIEIYDNAECIGAAVPKTAETLSVIVKVDRKASIKNKANELSDVFWEDFLVFFGSIISLIFGVILFKFRKKIKKFTGFDGKE